jgi:hypothetical protein
VDVGHVEEVLHDLGVVEDFLADAVYHHEVGSVTGPQRSGPRYRGD